MKIRTSLKNEILGDCENFWSGDSKDIKSIPNKAAFYAAMQVINTIVDEYTYGMWKAEKLNQLKGE